MLPDKKKIAGIIVSRMDKGGGDIPPPDGSEDDDLHSLAADFLSAVKTDNPAEVADAFRSMFMALDGEEDGGDDEGPDDAA